jgi:hypothetical protein
MYLPTCWKVLCVANLGLNIAILDVTSWSLPNEVIKVVLYQYVHCLNYENSFLISDAKSSCFLHEVFSSGVIKWLLNLSSTIPVLHSGK